MAYFAPDMVCYMDATLGWDFDSYAALKAVFEQYMPTWAPPARSYASKILAGEHSALVHMVDTPELFGASCGFSRRSTSRTAERLGSQLLGLTIRAP